MDKNSKTLCKCITSNTSAIWQQTANTIYKPSSLSCSTKKTYYTSSFVTFGLEHTCQPILISKSSDYQTTVHPPPLMRLCQIPGCCNVPNRYRDRLCESSWCTISLWVSCARKRSKEAQTTHTTLFQNNRTFTAMCYKGAGEKALIMSTHTKYCVVYLFRVPPVSRPIKCPPNCGLQQICTRKAQTHHGSEPANKNTTLQMCHITGVEGAGGTDGVLHLYVNIHVNNCHWFSQ